MDRGPENAAFTEALASAKQLWDDDKLGDCIEEALDLLEVVNLPRYHEISALLLLASCVEDSNLSDYYRIEAEDLWTLVRRWHPEGDAATDATLNRLHAIIVELKQEVKAELRADLEEAKAGDEAEIKAEVEEVAQPEKEWLELAEQAGQGSLSLVDRILG